MSPQRRIAILLSLMLLPACGGVVISGVASLLLANPERNAFLYTLWRGLGFWYLLVAYIAVVTSAVTVIRIVILWVRGSRTTSSDPFQDAIVLFIQRSAGKTE